MNLLYAFQNLLPIIRNVKNIIFWQVKGWYAHKLAEKPKAKHCKKECANAEGSGKAPLCRISFIFIGRNQFPVRNYAQAQHKPQSGKEEPKKQNAIPQLVQPPEIVHLPSQRSFQCYRCFLLLLQSRFPCVRFYKQMLCQCIRASRRIAVNDREFPGT